MKHLSLLRKCALFLILAALVSGLALPASADIAFEPNDSFYKSHSGNCHYEDRTYHANGPEGYVLIYTSPKGSAESALPNATAVYVSYTYNDGEWGCIEYDPEAPGSGNWQNNVSGWVKMADMICDYDDIAFLEEHEAELTEAERTLTIEPDDTVYCYKYPGSGIVTDTLVGAWASGPLGFSTIFVDSAGREWGHLGYFRGYRDCWICLDDPTNDALAPDENFHSYDFVPAASASDLNAAVKSAASQNVYVYAGAAGVVVIAAAVLAAVLRRKKAR